MKKRQKMFRVAVSALAISSFCISLNGIAGTPIQIGDTNRNLVQAAEVKTYTTTIDGVTWLYEKGSRFDANFQPVDVVKNIRPKNKDTLPFEVEIPEEIDGMLVSTVAENAFSNTKIKKVVIPDSVSTINASAFANCEALTEIRLPKELTTVYNHAFENCKAIREVCVRDVYDYAFSGCVNLGKVSFTLSSYDTAVTIKSHAFENCTSLNELVFEEKTTKINVSSYGFAGCTALNKWSVPRAMLDISYFGFANCTNLEQFDFSRKSYAQYGAFQNCTALSDVVFKEDATLGLGAFDNCTNLKTVTFEGNAYQSYSSKAQSVFSNCTSLKQVTFQGKESDIEIAKDYIGVQEVAVIRSNEPLKREVPKKQEMAVGTDTLSCSVFFDANGGLIENLTNKIERIYEKESVIKDFPTVVRSGYTLAGWYDKASGGKKVTEATVIGGEQNRILYAHWKKVNVKAGKIKKITKKTATSISMLFEKQSGVEGYEVICSTNKNFSSEKKRMIKSTSLRILALSKGKTYYVKVRAYKTDSTGKKVYGKYSSTKQVKL